MPIEKDLMNNLTTNFNDNRESKNSGDYDSINAVVKEMQQYYVKHKGIVPVEYLESAVGGTVISSANLSILEKNPHIFYKCTAKKFVLIKWIFDVIEKMFNESNENTLLVEEIYECLRKEFSASSVNRQRLAELIGDRSTLSYNKFKNVKPICFDGNVSYGYIDSTTAAIGKSIRLSDKLKSFINDLFNDNIYSNIDSNVCLGTLSDGEKEVLASLIDVLDILGEDICRVYLKNPKFTLAAYEVLMPLSDKYIAYNEVNHKLKDLIGSIHPSNSKAKIDFITQAYSSSEDVVLVLSKIFKSQNINFVGEIPQVLTWPIDIEIKNVKLLEGFIKWLDRDTKIFAYEEFQKIFNGDRNSEIFTKRAQGHTLEVVGSEYDLTRERVRQIEKKMLGRLQSYIVRVRPQHILLAFSRNNYLLNNEQIKEIFKDLTDVLIYGLKTIEDIELHWVDDLNSFVNNKAKWYGSAKQAIDSFPDSLDKDELQQRVIELTERLPVKIDQEVIKFIAENSYKIVGQTFTRTRMSKNRMYQIVVEKYFPDGIKIFDDFEMMRFKNYFKIEFGDIELSDNNRAIAARMADGLVLCDRGKHILPDKVNISDELLQIIIEYVQTSKKNTIMFHELFEVFKDELLQYSNIDNRYYLQGVIKHRYPNSFIYSRDTLSKVSSESRSIRHEIEEFVKNKGGIVTKDEIKKEFPGITEIVINLHTGGNENILLWDFSEYLYVSNLNIDDDVVKRLHDSLNDYTKQGTVSSRKLYEELFNQETEFMLENNINGHNSLFSVLQYLFGDEYEFSRPYIAPKNSTTLTEDRLIKEYIENFDELTISDLKEYLEDMHIRIMNYTALLDDISKDFLRIDEELLVRRNRLDLTDDIMERIEDTTIAIIGQTGYISSRLLNDFCFYPNIGVRWTPFLLISILKTMGRKVKVIDIAVDYRYLNSIFVNADLDITDIDSLLHYAIKKGAEMNAFDDLSEIEKYLKEQGLISNSIPDSLFEKGYLTNDEFTGMKIL